MKALMKKLRARLERRATRTRALRVRYPAACGYEAAWPSPEPIRVLNNEGARHETA